MNARHVLVVLFAVAVAAGLTGCGGSKKAGTGVSTWAVGRVGNADGGWYSFSDLQLSGSPEAWINRVQGARILSPTRLGIVTMGSSRCPNRPKRLVVQNPHAIRIYLVMATPPDLVCTADYGATRFVVAIDPKLIDVRHRLTLRFYYPRGKKPVVRTAPPL